MFRACVVFSVKITDSGEPSPKNDERSSLVSNTVSAHRVHPVDKGTVGRLRALVCNAVDGAIIE